MNSLRINFLVFLHHPSPGKLCARWNFRLVVKFRDDLTNSWVRVKPRVASGCIVKSRLHSKREWSLKPGRNHLWEPGPRGTMAGLLKFLAVFYTRKTVGTISRGGTARSLEREEGEREPPVGELAGYGRGKATRLSRGPGLISPHLHPRLLTDVPLDTARAHFTATTSDFILSPASFVLLLGPVSIRASKFPTYERHMERVNEISHSFIDIE